MTDVVVPLPTRRPELLVRPLGSNGQHVVKDPGSGDYFHLGGQEAFLLEQLDGRNSSEAICNAFEQQFDEPLTQNELSEFVALARTRGLLSPEALQQPKTEQQPSNNTEEYRTSKSLASQAETTAPAATPTAKSKSRQSILYWRKSLFDPDLIFGWLAPKIRFVWTQYFFVLSALLILGAGFVAYSNAAELVTKFSFAMRWETLAVAWLTLFAVTMCHEFAHGLTCKHHGGEVREIGFLLMFFMPCFYCNVSDAWLFREKSKRLWVTLAGGYCDLCIWALAVFVWRLTYQDSLINYLSWVVLSVTGFRVFFNFNPFLKLDGYYLLSDGMDVPNLRQRSVDRVMAYFRWLFWGGARPAAEAKGRLLFVYGLSCWIFSLLIVTFMLVMLGRFLYSHIGVPGVAAAVLLGVITGKGLLRGLVAGEFVTMLARRHKRALVWLFALSALVTASMLIPWTNRASGTFVVRPVTHREIRAPAAGFLRAVGAKEGDPVQPGQLVARLSIPDLPSRICQKEAEVRESEAKLKMLKAGPPKVELVQQRQRVRRAVALRDVTLRYLEKQKVALTQELAGFDKQLAEQCAKQEYAESVLNNRSKLEKKGAVSYEQILALRKEALVASAQHDATQAGKSAREALGTLVAETELAEREKELAVEQAALALVEAGTRPEEIEAAEAQVSRLRQELEYLFRLQTRLEVHSPVEGSLVTPHIDEKIGDYFEEGELICEIEDLEDFEVVISLDEDQAAKVRAGQQVQLKARALPFEVYNAEVVRIAPKAKEGELQNTIYVYCKLKSPVDAFTSGMSGHARINCGEHSIGLHFLQNCLRLIRTEFWW